MFLKIDNDFQEAYILYYIVHSIWIYKVTNFKRTRACNSRVCAKIGKTEHKKGLSQKYRKIQKVKGFPLQRPRGHQEGLSQFMKGGRVGEGEGEKKREGVHSLLDPLERSKRACARFLSLLPSLPPVWSWMRVGRSKTGEMDPIRGGGGEVYRGERVGFCLFSFLATHHTYCSSTIVVDLVPLK